MTQKILKTTVTFTLEDEGRFYNVNPDEVRMDTAEAVTFLQSIPVWGYSGSIIDCGLMYRVAGEVYVINVAPKEIVLRSELTKVPQEILGRIRSRIATNFNISPEMIIEKTAAVKLGS